MHRRNCSGESMWNEREGRAARLTSLPLLSLSLQPFPCSLPIFVTYIPSQSGMSRKLDLDHSNAFRHTQKDCWCEVSPEPKEKRQKELLPLPPLSPTAAHNLGGFWFDSLFVCLPITSIHTNPSLPPCNNRTLVLTLEKRKKYPTRKLDFFDAPFRSSPAVGLMRDQEIVFLALS